MLLNSKIAFTIVVVLRPTTIVGLFCCRNKFSSFKVEAYTERRILL